MSNILAGLKTSNDIKQEEDYLGGRKIYPSDAYPVTILSAYIGYAKSKAMFVQFLFKMEDGSEYASQQYVTSGQDKGCLPYYEYNGEKRYLPGFNITNAICLMCAGKEISEMELEDKVVKVYDFDLKKEVPTSVQMLVELINQPVILGIKETLEDVNKKNDSTGQYEPTGETRSNNELDKVFHAETKLTLPEAKAGAEEAEFYTKWVEKNKGQVQNKAKGAKAGGVQSGSLKGGEKKASSSLFKK